MDTALQAKNIYELFRAGVLIKGAISAAEIIAGIVLFFVSLSAVTDFIISRVAVVFPDAIQPVLISLTLSIHHELLFVGAAFLALYLLSRGLIKLLLIWAMLRRKLWAYPSSLFVIGGFVLYQLYQIATTNSWVMVAVTLFDLAVMYFIWREYNNLKAKTLL